MGESLRGGGDGGPSEATQYFAKARDAFEKLAAEAEQDPSVARRVRRRSSPSKSNWAIATANWANFRRRSMRFRQCSPIRSRSSRCSRRPPGPISDGATAGGGVKKLERAIYGGYKLRSTGKNRIWGWLKLALVAERAARSDPKYEDVFFEARLEAARCRYLIGTKIARRRTRKELRHREAKHPLDAAALSRAGRRAVAGRVREAAQADSEGGGRNAQADLHEFKRALGNSESTIRRFMR